MSMVCVPSHTQWALMRVSSVSSTRNRLHALGHLDVEQLLGGQAQRQVVWLSGDR